MKALSIAQKLAAPDGRPRVRAQTNYQQLISR
jgi:hypothetical protein